MKTSKKLLAILLAALCILSSLGMYSSALEDIIKPTAEKEEPLLYTVSFDVSESGVKALYTPVVALSLGGPGYVTLGQDIPLAINHKFVAWVAEDGETYGPGDKVLVNEPITLTAVWEDKTDNIPEIIRTIQCAFESAICYIQKALGIIDTAKGYLGDNAGSGTQEPAVDPVPAV